MLFILLLLFMPSLIFGMEELTNLGLSAGEQEFLYHAKLGNLTQSVNDLKFNINVTDEHGWTALHTLCAQGKFDEIEKLLQHPKIEVNKKEKIGNSIALHSFCAAEGFLASQESRYCEILKKLIAAESELSAKDANGRMGFDHLISNSYFPEAIDILAWHMKEYMTPEYAATKLKFAVWIRRHLSIMPSLLKMPHLHYDTIREIRQELSPLKKFGSNKETLKYYSDMCRMLNAYIITYDFLQRRKYNSLPPDLARLVAWNVANQKCITRATT